MTFSITARCAKSGRFGIAISSSSPAVAARCAHVRAGAGAACTQNITDPRLGPAALDRMAAGASAPDALEALRSNHPHIEYRQLAAVDAQGRVACFSGARMLGIHASKLGQDCVASGNLLANPGVPAAMTAAFEASDAAFGARLLAALAAGLAAGGEAGPVRSAGLLIADREAWPVTDLRVDWNEADPIAALAALWAVWAPQEAAYVARALAPDQAPRYGVPGDLPNPADTPA